MTLQAGSRPGTLTEADIALWQRRLESSAGGRLRAPVMHLSGHGGIASYGRHVELSVEEPSRFRALLHARAHSMIATFASLTTPMRVDRTMDLIRAEASDDVVVGALWTRGRQRVRQDGADRMFWPGQLTIVSNSRPYWQLSEGISDPVGIVIPVNMLGRERLLLRKPILPLPGTSVLARATASFISSFVLRGLVIDAPEADHAAQTAVIDLVAQTLREAATGVRPSVETPVLQRQLAVEMIERNYWESDFDVDMLAHQLHISRRQLYRLFEESGERPAAVIADRRVSEAERLMRENPGLPVAAVGKMAGFASEAAFRSRFADRRGMSPAGFRRSLLDGPSLEVVPDSSESA